MVIVGERKDVRTHIFRIRGSRGSRGGRSSRDRGGAVSLCFRYSQRRYIYTLEKKMKACTVYMYEYKLDLKLT